MRRWALAVAALMAVGASAQAQVRPEPTSFDSQCPNGVKGSENSNEESRDLKLKGAEVDGCIVKPGVVLIPAPHHATFSSLIRVRANFTPEMTKSAEQL